MHCHRLVEAVLMGLHNYTRAQNASTFIHLMKCQTCRDWFADFGQRALTLTPAQGPVDPDRMVAELANDPEACEMIAKARSEMTQEQKDHLTQWIDEFGEAARKNQVEAIKRMVVSRLMGIVQNSMVDGQ